MDIVITWGAHVGSAPAQFQGTVHGASSLISGAVALFLGRVDNVGAPQLSEGIAAVRTVEISELELMIERGEITDAFTLGAVLRARLKGLL